MTTNASDAAKREQLIARQREYLFPSVGTYYKDPLVPVRAHGSWVEDADGREYLDFFSGVLTTSLGHCHPELLAAVQEQSAALGHTSTLYVTAPQVEAAERLARLAPGSLKRGRSRARNREAAGSRRSRPDWRGRKANSRS